MKTYLPSQMGNEGLSSVIDLSRLDIFAEKKYIIEMLINDHFHSISSFTVPSIYKYPSLQCSLTLSLTSCPASIHICILTKIISSIHIIRKSFFSPVICRRALVEPIWCDSIALDAVNGSYSFIKNE